MPTITEIVVTAGRTFNHPYEQYSNLRPAVTMKATLSADEDPEAAVRQLQATAEHLVETHKTAMLQSLAQLERMSAAQQRIADLGQSISRNQAELDRLREELDAHKGNQLTLAGIDTTE